VRRRVQRDKEDERCEQACSDCARLQRALPGPVSLQVEAAQPCGHLVLVASLDVLRAFGEVRRRHGVRHAGASRKPGLCRREWSNRLAEAALDEGPVVRTTRRQLFRRARCECEVLTERQSER